MPQVLPFQSLGGKVQQRAEGSQMMSMGRAASLSLADGTTLAGVCGAAEDCAEYLSLTQNQPAPHLEIHCPCVFCFFPATVKWPWGLCTACPDCLSQVSQS